MKYTLSKILLFITFVFGLIIIFVLTGIIKFDKVNLLLIGFAFWTLIAVVVTYISLNIAASQKPKEIVKIVYKTAPQQEKKQDNKEQKEKELIQNYVKIVKNNLTQAKNIEEYSDLLFRNLEQAFKIVTGVFFLWDKQMEHYYITGTYAFYREDTDKTYKIGEGITGQVAKDKRVLYIDKVPEGYILVTSALVEGTPKYLVFIPIVVNDFTQAVIEFATFEPLPEPVMKILEAIAVELSKQFPQIVKL